MPFIDNVLQEPSYGWRTPSGDLVIPTNRQLFREAFTRMNVFADRKNWVPAASWLMILCLLPFAIIAFGRYFSLPLLGIGILYGMVIMSTHATIWFHRYCTHKAYTFSHPIWRFITQNLVVKTFPEEIYVVSHHVHHAKSDQPGDPYNARGGLFYCLLSDVNHQPIAKNLSEADYGRVAGFLGHTGIQANSYRSYLRWGSVGSPLYTFGLWAANWTFWYTIFFLIGGHPLACTMFTGALFWYVVVRTFNYTGHGKGEEQHVDGVDFDRRNLSINQWRPGLFAGEWHNNHHLYPSSARAGFLPFQLDLAWLYIYGLSKVGMVSSYRDNKADFVKKYVTATNDQPVVTQHS
ncbi:fatty acid desaturase [uncultured Spirosoma sp.]|uniref:fatty acid desaturase n=1 Tax=uncultured Spirosoma sp. TaxID=278208 RepID=UPI00258D2D51|nr:fatty acid desaturase [uncultured Spirosoma sp.]